MHRALVVAVLMVLSGTACATPGHLPADPRLAEAQAALEEGEKLKEAKQYTQAAPLVERALELREAALGKKHLKVADSLYLLGEIYSLQRDARRAEKHFQRALAIQEAALGRDHPQLINSLLRVLVVYASNDSLEQAEQLLQRLLMMDEALRDSGHSEFSPLLTPFTSLYAHIGLYEQRESLIQRALKIRETVLGTKHPGIIDTLRCLAELFSQQGRYAWATPLYERMLAIQEESFGGYHPSLIYTLSILADLYNRQELHEQAEASAQRAQELLTGALRSHHPSLAPALRELADAYRSQEYYARAEPLYERALAVQEEALGKHHPGLAQPLSDLADTYRRQGYHARAGALYERVLAIQEATLGKHHPDLVQPLQDLAGLYGHQLLHARAEQLYERALAIQETALGRQHPGLAATIRNLADFYNGQGLHARAEQLYERALTIQEVALGWHHPGLATTLGALARFYKGQGLYNRAGQLYERALAIQEAALGKHHPGLAATLEDLGNLYEDQGLHVRAGPLYERALAIQEVALGKHHLRLPGSLLKLAGFYKDQGLHAKAEPLYERGLTIQETVLGKNHPGLAVTLRIFARSYQDQGLHAKARPLYMRALAIQEAALGKNHPDLADSLYALAGFYEEQKLYARAEPLSQRALEIQEAAFGKHHPILASRLTALADRDKAQGLHAQAESLYERVLEIEEAALGSAHPHVAQRLNEIAGLRVAQQRLAEALPVFKRAFTISEAHLRQELFGFSEARLANVLLRLREEEELLYSLVRAYPGDAQVRHIALSAALLRKGRSVEELAGTSRIIYRGLSQADRKLFERLRALRTQYSTLSLAGPGPLSPAEYQQRLKELANQGDALETELARRSARLRNLSAQPPAFEFLYRVAETLPRNSVLVELVAYRDTPIIPRTGSEDSQRQQQLRYLALLLFADGSTRALDLGPAEPIDRAALRLHDALARSAVSFQPASQELYRLAFRPLVPLLGKAQRILLAPDGQLAFAPFAALHDGSRYLVDTWDITYLTSGKDLLPRPADISPARAVVVLADPDFSTPPAPRPPAAQLPLALVERSALLERFFSTPRSELADQPWPPLPGTREEARTIKFLFPEAQVLLGRAASKEALLKLEAPGLLHIATHGFFLEDASAPKDSRAVAQCCTMASSGPPQSPPDPLLRSGLVLAGAQARPDAPAPHVREDSLVTALELAGLNLWGTQLVVLSACDTGRGDVKLGQGVYGMRRALVAAGAETLVTSLWKVNDETTRELMESYYRNLLAGQGRSGALRQAMRTLRQKHPHPHFWAPFITIGKDAPLRGLTAESQETAEP